MPVLTCIAGLDVATVSRFDAIGLCGSNPCTMIPITAVFLELNAQGRGNRHEVWFFDALLPVSFPGSRDGLFGMWRGEQFAVQRRESKQPDSTAPVAPESDAVAGRSARHIDRHDRV